MSTIAEAKDIVFERFKTVWANRKPADLPNERIAEPLTGAWVALTIVENSSHQETIGPVGYRNMERLCSLYVVIYTAINTGTTESDDLAQVVRTMFETWESGDVRFRQVYLRNPAEDGRWYRVVIEALFTYIETV